MSGVEYQVQLMAINFLQTNYPDVLFRSDLGGFPLQGWKLAKEAKALNPIMGWPDLFIAVPKDTYLGCFLELKGEGVEIRKTDGSLASLHLKQQSDIIKRLNRLGFYAKFTIGVQDIMDTLRWYMSLPDFSR